MRHTFIVALAAIASGTVTLAAPVGSSTSSSISSTASGAAPDLGAAGAVPGAAAGTPPGAAAGTPPGAAAGTPPGAAADLTAASGPGAAPLSNAVTPEPAKGDGKAKRPCKKGPNGKCIKRKGKCLERNAKGKCIKRKPKSTQAKAATPPVNAAAATPPEPSGASPLDKASPSTPLTARELEELEERWWFGKGKGKGKGKGNIKNSKSSTGTTTPPADTPTTPDGAVDAPVGNAGPTPPLTARELEELEERKWGWKWGFKSPQNSKSPTAAGTSDTGTPVVGNAPTPDGTAPASPVARRGYYYYDDIDELD